MRIKQANGILTVYAGPMYAGKTTALIAELEDATDQGLTSVVVKPSIDNRYSNEDIVSHDGTSLQKITGHPVRQLNVDDVLLLDDLAEVDVLLIDEAQFFTNLSQIAVKEYLAHGIDVVAVGLDMDSEGRPFGSMPTLLTLASNIYKLTGICSVCAEEATRTYRKLSASTVEQVLIGGDETYEPRCLQHWLDGQAAKRRWLA